MPTKPATTDRRLRSQASEDDIASEVEFNIRTESDSRSNSESEDGGNETILNTSNDTNMSEQRGGGERIDLTNVEQTVRVEVTGEEERKRSAMRATANVFVPAPVPPTASLDATQMMMAMMVQFQEQARLDREQIREDRERARLDTLQLQREIAELRNARAPAPARPTHLRTGKPPQFDIENDRNKFATWRSKWGYHIKSSGIADLTGTHKAETMRAELNLAMSDATICWLNNLNITHEQKEDTEFVINKLEQYIKGSTNPLVAVVDCLKIKHPVNSPVQTFFTAVLEQVKMCDCEKITNPKDWICLLATCLNMNLPTAMTKILLLKDFNFQTAMDIAIEEEKAVNTAKQLNGGADPYAAATSTYKADRNAGNQNRQGGQQERGRSGSRGHHRSSRSDSSSTKPEARCKNCGNRKHKDANQCPAKGKDCKKCLKIGHFAQVCRGGPSANRMEAEPVTSRIEASPSLGNMEVGSTNIEALDLIEVRFRGQKGNAVQVLALPDTGANITAMSPEQFEQSGNQFCPEQAKQPKSADGSRLQTIGKSVFQVEFKNKSVEAEVYIIKGLEKPIISRRLLKVFKLIPEDFPHAEVAAVTKAVSPVNPIVTGHGPELDELMNKYAKLFDGNCKVMKNGDYHIDLDPEAVPINTGASRSVPDPYMPALKKEIENLLAQGIIEEVSGATPWLHPIVVVSKKNTTDIRMCVDLTKLNRYVRRPTNPQLTPWEVIRNIPKGTKHYAVFDALKGYHQVELDEESRALTTFMTPFGRYRYRRMPMGLSSAGDVFTLKYGNAVDQAVDGRRATEDTLLRGATTQELYENTEEFFKSCLENNITLNVKKIQWDKKEVLFGGFLLTPEGYQIDPALNKALAEFPVPTNQTDVRSFMGLANQTCNFSSEISNLLSPLKGLLKKGTKFDWLPEHQTAFEKARSHLSSNKALAFYDAAKPTRLIADASRLFGLGFVLKQEVEPNVWKTVQAGSRFLSPAETRYAMIELELLAICWAANKCRMFIEGLPRAQFEIWTDHQPLVPILEKYSLPEIENRRLQRLKMKLDHLTFRTKWIKGADNEEADSLSRNPCAKAKPSDELDELNNVYVATLAVCGLEDITEINEATMPIRDQRLQEVIKAAKLDPEYILLRSVIETGFPNEKSGMPESLASFWQYRNDLYIDSDNFVVYKNRLFIPTELRYTYLQRLLAMHQAEAKMMARARKSIWWPFITNDVANTALSCKTCQEYKPSNRAEPLRAHEQATYPFQFVHMDLGEVNGKYFLIAVDQYSGFPQIYECGKTAKTNQIISFTIDLFENFSVPMTIYSDGGPQFKENGDFDKFCKEWGIEHVTSSPHMSNSNGVAEEAVKEMKKIIRANVSPSGVLNRPSTVAGLMMFRNTPRSPTDLSPAQLIFGQDIRDSLPITRASLKPEHRFAAEERLQKVREEKRKGKGRKEMELLKQGQKVFVQHPGSKRWTSTATVLRFGINDREYIVRNDENGREYRRNRKFLRPQRVQPVTPPRQPVPAPELHPLQKVKVPSEPSVPRVVPEPDMATNNRPQRQKKPIIRFEAGHNKYYEPVQWADI